VFEALKEIDYQEVTALWEKVFAVCSKHIPTGEEESVEDMRNSRRWMDHVVDESLLYLQNQ